MSYCTLHYFANLLLSQTVYLGLQHVNQAKPFGDLCRTGIYAGGQTQEEKKMQKIDLDTAEYTALFAEAEIYAQKGTVQAVRVTAEGLREKRYTDKDVRYDEELGYVVDTYQMHAVPANRTIGYSRRAILTQTHLLRAGDWIVTKSPTWVGDHPMNYVMSDEAFRRRRISTNVDGVYRVRELLRIIPNPTGRAVVIDAPWGERQSGESDCCFCAPYDPNDPENLALGGRYLLSDTEFSNNYGLASEVIGPDWQQSLTKSEEVDSHGEEN